MSGKDSARIGGWMVARPAKISRKINKARMSVRFMTGREKLLSQVDKIHAGQGGEGYLSFLQHRNRNFCKNITDHPVTYGMGQPILRL